MAPALRAGAKIGPYFIVGVDGGLATAFGLRFVWPNLPSQRSFFQIAISGRQKATTPRLRPLLPERSW